MVLSIGPRKSISLLPAFQAYEVSDLTSVVYSPLYRCIVLVAQNGRAGFAASAIGEDSRQSAEPLHVTLSATSENNVRSFQSFRNSLSSSLLRPPSTKRPFHAHRVTRLVGLRGLSAIPVGPAFIYEAAVDPDSDHRWDFPLLRMVHFGLHASLLPRQVAGNLFASTIPPSSASPEPCGRPPALACSRPLRVTPVTACTLAGRPMRLLHRRLSSFVSPPLLRCSGLSDPVPGS